KNEKAMPMVLKDINNKVKPNTDFYEFAVGSWLKNNPIPDEYSRWGSFEILAEENYKILKDILEAASKSNSPKGSIEQKIGDFFNSGMNTKKIEQDGSEPVKPILSEINLISNYEQLNTEIANLHNLGLTPLFSFSSAPDAKNSSTVIAQLRQSGLGLPDRDYYLNTDLNSKEIREKYQKHIAKMFELTGQSKESAAKIASDILQIETRLARSSMDKVALRDPYKTYNKMSADDLGKLSPDFNWKLYFRTVGIENPGDINVAQPDFFKDLSAALKEISLDQWKGYLKWNVLRNSADYLSSNFVDEKFAFYGKTLNGLKILQPRWKRVLLNTNNVLGEALGQLFVEKTFPPEAKQRASAIVENLLKAMEERIKGLDWMSEQTKQQALKKLQAFTVKIGYPDKWIDYSNLGITKDSFYNNILNGFRFEFKREIAKIGKPVDRSEWEMYPQTVNAYYEPSKNEICFPAAILQPPFFNTKADDALNYGAMGAVIGHEITHGFDDEGRQYDEQGNVKDWWTKEDGKKFDEKAAIVAKQYENFYPVEGMHLNGSFTNGENIADLGGLTVALTAFKKTEQYKNRQKIDGFTPEQRFFLSWAQVWKNNIREEALKLRINTDPHSPGKYRVIGPLSNMPEFWDAFSIKPGDSMYKEKELQVKIW
ncbi:MAG: M13 family metallopeptidase, partial [Bacillota bacterium]